MKYLFHCLILCVATLSVQAQTNSLQSVVESYLSAIETKDYASLASHLDHAIFTEMTPEEMAEGVMAAMMGDDAMPMEISNSTFVESGDEIDFDGIKYAPVRISYIIQIPFMDEYTEMLVENLQLSHGEDNVVLDDENDTITASVEEYIIARFDEDQNTWKLFTRQMMYFSYSMDEELQINILEQISAWKLDRMLN